MGGGQSYGDFPSGHKKPIFWACPAVVGWCDSHLIQWKHEESHKNNNRCCMCWQFCDSFRETGHGDRFFSPCMEDWNCKKMQTHTLPQTCQMDVSTHELAPLCVRIFRWAECWDGMYLCGLFPERPRWVIPAAVFPLSKRVTTGLALQATIQHLFNLGLCLHLSSAPRLKAAALPLCSVVRRMTIMKSGGCPPLHTHQHSQFNRNTDKHSKTTPFLTLHCSTTTCLFTHTQCEMQVAISFGPCHTECASVSCLNLQFTAKCSLNIVYYAVFFIF